MSQGEVLEVLKEQKEPISAKEIANKIDTNQKHVYVSLKCLIKYKEVKCIEITRDEAKKRYGNGYNRRLRLYYVA